MAKSKSPYDVHPGVEMVRKWIRDLPEKTGRSLEQWSEVYRRLAKKYPVRKELVAQIKGEHGLGTVTAEQIWEYTFNSITWDADDDSYLKAAAEYVEGQYTGAKSHFKPLFDAVTAYARTLGNDVKICPCKTMVPLYRNRVFAEMRPATKTRFELALCLGDTPFDEMLKRNPRAKGNDRLTHLIAMETLKDFNAAAKKWLKTAYVRDAKK